MIKGSCLCQSVSYVIEAAEPMIAGECFCVDCRKASGTSHCTHAAFPEEALRLSGELKFFDKPADSGNVVSRGFCPACGSAILSRNSSLPGMVFIRASSMEDPDQITPQMTVYASRAPKWARLNETAPVFAEMPPDGPPAEG